MYRLQLTPEIVTSWILLWITTVVLFAGIHFFMIEVKRTKPNYMQWFIIRGFFAIVYAVPFQLLNMGEYLPIFLFQVTSHFVIFNPLLNYLRQEHYEAKLSEQGYGGYNHVKYSFWYLGKESGWLDKLLARTGPVSYIVIYFASAAVMGLAAVTIYMRYA